MARGMSGQVGRTMPHWFIDFQKSAIEVEESNVRSRTMKVETKVMADLNIMEPTQRASVWEDANEHPESVICDLFALCYFVQPVCN
jgi:hypothetical protein